MIIHGPIKLKTIKSSIGNPHKRKRVERKVFLFSIKERKKINGKKKIIAGFCFQLLSRVK